MRGYHLVLGWRKPKPQDTPHAHGAGTAGGRHALARAPGWGAGSATPENSRAARPGQETVRWGDGAAQASWGRNDHCEAALDAGSPANVSPRREHE